MAITIKGRRATPEEAAAIIERRKRRQEKNAKASVSESSEMWREHREHQQAKRAANAERSTNLLKERGVFFTSHNAGTHLIVADRWDFWPSTGKWIERKGRPGHPKRSGRGVFALLDLIQEQDHD